jgi:hypothetical protein
MGTIEMRGNRSRRGSGTIGTVLAGLEAGELPPSVAQALSQKNRLGAVDRRPSNLNIMPTLHDEDEKEDGDCDSEEVSEMSMIDEGLPISAQLSDKIGTGSGTGSGVIHAGSDIEISKEAHQQLHEEIAIVSKSADRITPERIASNADVVRASTVDASANLVNASADFESPHRGEGVSSCSSTEQQHSEEPKIVSLDQLPFTRDIDIEQLRLQELTTAAEGGSSSSGSFSFSNQNRSSLGDRDPNSLPESDPVEQNQVQMSSRSVSFAATSSFGTYKVATAVTTSKTWRTLPLPELLSAKSASGQSSKKYPNTPLSMAWYEKRC